MSLPDPGIWVVDVCDDVHGTLLPGLCCLRNALFLSGNPLVWQTAAITAENKWMFQEWMAAQLQMEPLLSGKP